MENNYINYNPWIGLETYKEGQRLYGREDDIHALSQNILFNIQTVIYGKSGIGKSSILNAGIFPILRKSNFFPCYIRLVHNQPNNSYNQQIWDSVLNSLYHLKKEKLTLEGSKEIVSDLEGRYEELAPARENECLWEIFHRHKFYDESNNVIQPVLVFDQFEEIFTREKNIDKVNIFFEELADLINNVVPERLCNVGNSNVLNSVEMDLEGDDDSLLDEGYEALFADYLTDSNFHIVLSLREDYLSYLERNIDNIPSLKHNRYCLKPLSEEQAASVIMKPCPGLIMDKVAKEIISKVTGVSISRFELGDKAELEVDSAILSLFLRELFEKKPVDSRTIDISLIDEFGDNIIQSFYEKIMSQISHECAEYLEKRLTTKDGKRDSLYKSYLIKDKGFNESDIELLKEKRIIREFPWNDGTRIEFIHDVLCPIIVKRKEQRRIEREKIEADRVREEERRQQEEALIKIKKDKQRYMFACLLVIVSVCLSVLFIWDGWFHVKTKRYRQIVKVNTWMEGIGKLSKKEASYLPFHYVVYKTGRYANFPDSIEARNGYGKLTTNHTMSTYLINHMDDTDNKADAEMQKKLASVVKWILVSKDNGKHCLQENAYDSIGKLVFAYNNTILEEDSMFISTYVNEYGFPIMMRDSCNIYLRTTLDQNGHEILQEFFDTKGLPTRNKDDAFQTARTYFSNGIQQSEASLFLNGYPMNDRWENCGWVILERNEDGINSTWSAFFNREGLLCEIMESVMFKQYTYDEYGRLESESYWKSDSNHDIDDVKHLFDSGARHYLNLFPDTDKNGLHKTTYKYNRYGQCTYVCCLDTANNLIVPTNRDYAEFIRDYDDEGNRCYVALKDSNGKTTWESFEKYNDDNKLIYCLQYNINQYGDTLLDYHLYYDHKTNCKMTKSYYHDDNYYTLQEYDKDENLLSTVWYTIDSNKPDGDMYGRYKKSLTYDLDRDLKRTTITALYYDTLDRYCAVGGYFKEIEVVDSLSCTKSNQRYSTDSIRYIGYEYKIEPEEVYYVNGAEKIYDHKFEVPLGEYSLDKCGKRRRTYENNAYYYKTIYIRSVLSHQYNDVNDMYMVNEFGEPSLVRWGGELFSTQYKGVRYDEYGQEITEDLDRYLFAAIDVEDGVGFEIGDILVEQDDWVMFHRNSTNYLNTSPDPDTEHHFKVLRYNESTNKYDVVEINTPAGETRLIDIQYKINYCTEKESKRIFSIINEKICNSMFEFVPNEGGILWNNGMTSPALLVSFNDWDMTQQFSGYKDSIWSMIKNNEGNTKYITVYDEKLKAMQTYVIDSDTLDIQLKSYTITPRYYDEILEKMYIHKKDTIK